MLWQKCILSALYFPKDNFIRTTSFLRMRSRTNEPQMKNNVSNRDIEWASPKFKNNWISFFAHDLKHPSLSRISLDRAISLYIRWIKLLYSTINAPLCQYFLDVIGSVWVIILNLWEEYYILAMTLAFYDW